MIAIPNERLRERAREKVMGLEFAFTQTAFADSRAELEEELELARIALASLTAEPVAWIVHARTGDQLTTDGGYVANAEGILGLHSTPLYAAPPAPVPVPDDLAKAFISAIEKEQDRLFGEDYLMDSKDCVDVIREEAQRLNVSTAPLASVRGSDARNRRAN